MRQSAASARRPWSPDLPHDGSLFQKQSDDCAGFVAVLQDLAEFPNVHPEHRHETLFPCSGSRRANAFLGAGPFAAAARTRSRNSACIALSLAELEHRRRTAAEYCGCPRTNSGRVSLHRNAIRFLSFPLILANEVAHHLAFDREGRLEGETLILSVADNGKGLPSFNTTPNRFGNGFSNMKQRI